MGGGKWRNSDFCERLAGPGEAPRGNGATGWARIASTDVETPGRG